MNGRGAAAVLNASILLDGEDRILEGNRDAEVFLEKPLEEVRKTPLSKANPALYTVLKELLAKTRRGRGVEDYAMAYKVGKRLMRLNINMSPYPLEALGDTGTLVSINSVGMRPPAERRAGVEEPPPPAPPEEAPDLQQLLDIMAEPSFLLDMEANFSYANPSMCSLLGHDQGEIIGRPLSFFLLKDDARQALDCLVEAVCAAPWRGELEFNRGDGTTSSIAVTINTIKGARGRTKCLLGIGRDTTTEARIRREREDELQRIWSMLERVGVALACFTPDLRVTLLSRSAEEMLSTTGDRAIGTPLPDLFPEDTRGEVVALLERALKGEDVEEALVQVESGDERSTVFMSVKQAVQANGRTREYMAILREAARELSEVERAEARLEVSRRGERAMRLAARALGVRDFLERYIEEAREEYGCDAAGIFGVKRGEAVLRAQHGLDEDEERKLAVLGLRPGHARLCGMLRKLSVEIHGGVPRKGWEEVHSIIEKADTLLPILKERRWRGILVLPLRGEGEAIGAIVLCGCDPARIDTTEDAVFTAMSEAVASALLSIEARIESAADVAGREVIPPAEPEERATIEVITRKASTRRHDGTGLDEGEPGESAPSGDKEGWERGSGMSLTRKEEHDYFEIAMEVKGEEVPPDNLALFEERHGKRYAPSSKGVDISSLLWEMKEFFGRGERKGELFLEIEEDLPKLHTDRRLLREALIRLIDNACKFSPPSSPVILGAERWGDEVLLRIEDQGPGIAPEVVEEVANWEPAAEDSPDSGRPRPSGLFECRKFVQAMGGDLSIKGRQEEGTTAFIRLRVLPFIGEGT